jgi:N,N'-diacetyllegionaminate synthase
MSVFIIAEAGVNHNGDIELAKKMIDVAVAARADAVKFQTFVAENVVSKFARKAEYQIKNTGNDCSMLQMIRGFALTFADFRELQAYCRGRGIMFLSTAFDLDSVRFLHELDVPMMKIPSGEITNLPYLIAVANTRRPVIMSTGMSDLGEIEAAVNVLKENGAGDIKLLHCNTEYPTPYEDVNLLAMQTLREKFGCEVGYSDHTPGIEVAVAAVAMGASVIEKHFTLDKGMEGPDHVASLEPDELKAMVLAIRNVEKAFGVPEKKVSESERRNIEIARKSIVAKKSIKKGDIFSEENITTKRPGSGISPMKWFEVLGKTAVRDFGEDETIEL